ncbi:HNH endonuclease [Rhodococcus sp. BP-149]|uniref:HNH endonuclease n=1 Tax=unclassified Rhodococcus (in: high G+C Gram-positive bacteria) TaxID=192944 RepID=UPI001DB6C0C3|nr:MULTISPECIES: HNH endonuclease [unclassified Rhodococcus (in: high G+C Gram-positive bacteria)]MBY6687218.1 HNH endonuclease [Rhodococcus sp. BP-288]MBY6694359.1 HNH endonuclease [Rhodococcus sp. BP-188]MBY6698068.1 HNH endonuclease [Rhodococcus sp. BP-285]MBY6704288.1 HNH endonuclease [Rhodococcus sp. BP-283]MBY6712937.1 HNH endonuclease [Rhodococcus sp. BP-160]
MDYVWPSTGSISRAWLVLSKDDQLGGRGGHAYDDDPSSRYVSDSQVPNSRNIAAGDALVVWDQKRLLGASVVERVDSEPGTKEQKKCPYCGPGRSLDERLTLTPRYKCGRCKNEFDVPLTANIDVTVYRTHHGEAWIDLAGELTAEQLRSVCTSPKSQLSIRELDWTAFTASLSTDLSHRGLNLMNSVSVQLGGGFTDRITRVRLGQPAFRAQLMQKYASNCAFSGAMPHEVLEAAHLYSYAQVGEHHDEGGLLLRRDLHRLFDFGKIAVRNDATIAVHKSLEPFELYGKLHGRSLTIEPTQRQQQWFAAHRTMWRVDAA